MEEDNKEFKVFEKIMQRRIKVLYPNLESDAYVNIISELWLICEKNVFYNIIITDDEINNIYRKHLEEKNKKLEINNDTIKPEIIYRDITTQLGLCPSDTTTQLGLYPRDTTEDYENDLIQKKLSYVKKILKLNISKSEDNYNYSRDMNLKDEICNFVTKINDARTPLIGYEYVFTFCELVKKYIENNNSNDDVIEYYSKFIENIDADDDITYLKDINSFTKNIFVYEDDDDIKNMLFEIFDV